MKIKSKIMLLALSVVCGRVDSSVAGITYRDDFSFEERYRNVRECDPFYWHPLHLPEDCADMYEQLIRARIPARLPKHSYFKSKFKTNIYPIVQTQIYPVVQAYEPNVYDYPEPTDEHHFPTEEIEYPASPELNPYEEMMESVKKDFDNLPSVPSVKVMPNFGPVAVYQQPVSKDTADVITKVATAYAHLPDGESEKTQDRKKKKNSKWRKLVNIIRKRERQGWKKRKYGDIITYSNT